MAGGGGGVVAGDHLHVDAGGVALRHGGDRLLPRRVDHPDEAQQHEARADLVEIEHVLAPGGGPAGEGEHALPLRRDALDLVVPGRAVEGRVAPVRAARRLAHRKQPLGRALDEDVRAFARLGRPVERRHEAVLGVEGHGVEARPGRALRVRVEARLGGERDERALHRIALDPPAVLGARQRRVVAQERGAGEIGEERLLGGIDLAPVPREAAFRRIALARDLVGDAAGHHGRSHHLVAGEGAGLVGADHRDGAQRLDRGHPAHDRFAPRHALDPDGERDREQSRQPLRYRRDDETDDRDEQLVERVALDEPAEGEHRRGGPDDHHG